MVWADIATTRFSFVYFNNEDFLHKLRCEKNETIVIFQKLDVHYNQTPSILENIILYLVLFLREMLQQKSVLKIYFLISCKN